MPFSRWKVGLLKNTRSIHCVAACLILCGVVLGQTPRTSRTYDNIKQASRELEGIQFDDRTDENIYGLASIRQSIEEDRK